MEETTNQFELWLVGRFRTKKTINTRAISTKMADLWKPAMSINVKALKPGIFLFQFYHKDDMSWVMNNDPWSFDNVMLVSSTMGMGEDPMKVSLYELELWIQIYDLPSGGICLNKLGKNWKISLGHVFGMISTIMQVSRVSICVLKSR